MRILGTLPFAATLATVLAFSLPPAAKASTPFSVAHNFRSGDYSEVKVDGKSATCFRYILSPGRTVDELYDYVTEEEILDAEFSKNDLGNMIEHVCRY